MVAKWRPKVLQNALQYFWPALSYNWSWKPIFGLFESGLFTQAVIHKRQWLGTDTIHRRVAEFHMRLTFWENLPHRHKGWNRSQIKTKCLFFNFDWVVRSKIGSVISIKGEITLSLQKRELWSTKFESIFCSVKTLFFRKLFYFLKSI